MVEITLQQSHSFRQLLAHSCAELSLFWQECSHLPSDQFFKALGSLLEAPLINRGKEEYGTSFSKKGGVILTPFTQNIYRGADCIVRNTHNEVLLESFNKMIVPPLFKKNPLNVLIDCVRLILIDNSFKIYLFENQRKSNHVMFHRFCTMLYTLAISIYGKFDSQSHNRNDMELAPYHAIDEGQNYARMCILASCDEIKNLSELMTKGCNDVKQFADESGIIMNVLMKKIFTHIKDSQICKVKTAIVEFAFSQDTNQIENIVEMPISKNGIGLARNAKNAPHLNGKYEDSAHLNALKRTLNQLHHGSANVIHGGNKKMMNLRLLVKDKRARKIFARTGVTELSFENL